MDDEAVNPTEGDETAALVPSVPDPVAIPVEVSDGDWFDDDEDQVDLASPEFSTQALLAADAEVARLTAEVTKMTAEIEAAGSSQGPGSALVPTSGSLPAAQVKAAMASQRSKLLRSKKELKAAQRELERQMEVRLSAANNVLVPLKKWVAKLEDGILTVGLYLGESEHIVTLAEGAPASADTPIVVRQMVLAMDEETRVAAEHGGIDARDMEEFDRWVTADPAHLDQVLPEPRGVVVLFPRARQRDYGDPWTNQRMSEENKRSYWLIRNGGMLYRMSTNFDVGKLLIPAQDEFTKFFEHRSFNFETREYETRPLEPGSSAWLEAEERADDRRRHFMKAALILQGLIDRTAVFAPLPAEGVSLLGPDSYDAGHVRVITDAEAAVGDGHEPFRVWLKRLNNNLRPGMRIIGAFDGESFRAEREENRFGGGHLRVSPKYASLPQPGVLYYLDERTRKGGYVFRYDRTDEIWDNDRFEYRKAKTRASCTVFPDDDFVLPFDLVTVPELEMYIASRTDRKHYVELIPLMKSAIAAKKAEQDAEVPFRLMLAGTIARVHGVSVEDAAEGLPALVDWWKLANKWHRPLVAGDPKLEAKATKAIVAEFAARAAAAARSDGESNTESAATSLLLSRFPDAVFVGRKRDGSFAVFTPADDRNVFVHQHTLRRADAAADTREWVLPRSYWRKWTALYEGDRWAAWDHGASLSDHLTGPEQDRLIADLVAGYAGHRDGPVLAVTESRESFYLEHGFMVHLRGESPAKMPPPDRVLTGGPPKFETRTQRSSWKRTTGGKIELHRNTERWSNEEAWRFTSHDQVPPWSAHPDRVAFTDEVALAEVVALYETAKAQDREFDRLRTRRWAALNGIGAAWEAREEQRAFERFMADYQDAGLWDDHRKTLNINFGGRQDSELSEVVGHLLETGVDVTGMSVQAMMDAYNATAEKPVSIPAGIEELVPVLDPDDGEDDDFDDD